MKNLRDENPDDYEPEFLKELRQIRQKMYEETKDMTHEQKRAYMKERADRCISKLKNKPRRLQIVIK